MTRVAVIGIGQSLRGDDAVGPEAVRQWQERFPETANRLEVRVEASELPGLALLDLLSDARSAVLVDAVQSSHPPGTIHRLGEDELAAFASDAKSAHGWGVAETLKLGRQLRDSHPAVRVVGVTVENIETGAGMSAAVRGAIPKICEAIEEEARALLK